MIVTEVQNIQFSRCFFASSYVRACNGLPHDVFESVRWVASWSCQPLDAMLSSFFLCDAGACGVALAICKTIVFSHLVRYCAF